MHGADILCVVMTYDSTDGCVYRLGYHVIWCPKYRRRVLSNGVDDRLKELLYEKAAEQGWDIRALEVMPDHVHVFVFAPPKDSPARIAHQFKGYTSRVLRAEFASLRSRLPTLWTRSYFVASVGNVSEASIAKYIAEQKKS